MKKSLATIALVGSIALVGAAPSVAGNYPAPPPQAAVSDGVVGPGETFVFSGRGFRAGETIIIRVTPGARPASTGASIAGGPSRSVPGRIPMAVEQTFTTTADSNGAFAFPMSISEPGVYTLTATGQTSGVVVSATVTVVGNAGAADLANTGGQPLANTGADASLLLWGAAGIAALGLGAGGVIISRRRNTASA